MRRSTIGLMSVFLITCVLMSVSSAIIYAPGKGTSVITGYVFISECPPDTLKGMPCILKAAPGCVVAILYQTCDSTKNSKDYVSDGKFVYEDTVSSAISTTVRVAEKKVEADSNGRFVVTFDPPLEKGSLVTAFYGNQETRCYVDGEQIDRLDLYIQRTQPDTQPATPVQIGYSSLAGFVMGSDGNPAVSAKVFVYRDRIYLADALIGPGKKEDTTSKAVNLMTVTDANGYFFIDSIPIEYSPVSSYPPHTCYYIEAELNDQKAASKVELSIDRTDTVRLQLSGGAPGPIVNGTSSIEGFVYMGSNLTTSNQKLLNPVPGCTLVVTNEITPSLNAYKMDVPSTFQGYYIAMTDSSGHFKIENVQIWADGAPFIVMAQKNGRFATSGVNLYNGRTGRCDVVLGNVVNTYVPDSSITPEMKFYNDNKESILVSVKKSLLSQAKSLHGNFVSISSGRLTVTLRDAQALTVAVYSLSGKLINTICRDKKMASGDHLFDMNAIHGSAVKMIVKVTGEKFSYSAPLSPAVR